MKNYFDFEWTFKKYLFLLFFVMPVWVLNAQTMYRIIDVGSSIQTTGINDSGQVVFYDYTASGPRGFIWKEDVITDLGTLGGNATHPSGINNSGYVVGVSTTADTIQHAFIWQDGVMIDLSPNSQGYSNALDINNLNQICGNYFSSQPLVLQQAVMWDNGNMIFLGAGDYSEAISINDLGQIVYNFSGNSFIWDNGGHIPLGLLSSDGCSAVKNINNNSQVVGYQNISGCYNNPRAFLWEGGVLSSLGTDNGWANAINNNGDIVGTVLIPSPRAFLYSDGQMIDLNTMTDTTGGWILSEATGINNNGWIVGGGSKNNQQRTFLLIPVSYPVLIVPGIAGTYSEDTENDLGWIMYRGVPPALLQIDPLGKVYHDIIKTFENVGYKKDEDLFVVNYDWRVTPGPIDNVIDGFVGGLTGASITDNQFNYGVDYLGWYIKKACEKWREKYPFELDSIDVIAHSTGGIVTRTYIQSNAYGDIYDPINNYRLPTVRNFVMMGVPNRGASKAWNAIHDNWIADPIYRFVLSKILNSAYQKILRGGTVNGPDYDITLSSIQDSLGNPSKIKFINQYVPTLRGLLATYDFINFGNGYTNVNNDTEQRNSFVLDLNNGYDLYPNVDPNDFLDAARVSVIYGTGKSTFDLVEQRDDFELNAVQSFTDWTRTTVLGGTIWYKDLISSGNNGDETVPLVSSAGQFLNDSRAVKYPFSVGDHTSMMSNVEVQSTVLDILSVDYEQSNISTGTSPGIRNVLNVISDPVESIITDGSGNRLGYSNTTGALTEIPNSIWFGNTDGRGWVFDSVQEPINLQLTGLGEDYYVMVSVEDSGKGGGVVLEGFLALGEVINYQITLDPLSVDQINSLIPEKYELAQNYPNPFNPVTTIQYSLPQRSNVTLKIYDVLGKEIAVLVNEEKDRGVYNVSFDASHLSSGVYFYRLQAGSFGSTKKMILLR